MLCQTDDQLAGLDFLGSVEGLWLATFRLQFPMPTLYILLFKVINTVEVEVYFILIFLGSRPETFTTDNCINRLLEAIHPNLLCFAVMEALSDQLLKQIKVANQLCLVDCGVEQIITG